ncbi:HU family DNA-binding protein [Bacteroides bouchesdurhonensis]|uniref:HU family DNA-binding protein n=1 Tax=Bacteroides bouchesdurhonensis TaxID=1841855 RepID=UPI00097F8B3A|nr:DsbA family protein [Bacteroides bouchesdurhonensis]
MAKYDIYKVHGIDNKEKEEKYRARIVSEGTISKEKLYKYIEKTSGGFNRAQADAIMTCITDAVIEFLRDGYIVQLGELGYLSATVTSRPVKEKKEIRSGSVHFKNVNLRISSSLRKSMRSIPLERVEKPALASKEITLKQKEDILRSYLETHPCITRTDYCHITHTLKSKAVDDLNQFVTDGWLSRYGAGRTVIYLLVK